MKLSRRARYALRMMLVIAKYSEHEQRVSLAKVSETTNISRRYMEQLAMALKNAHLITGLTGKHGGYRLSRPARAIKVGDIIEAAIGSIQIVECIDSPEQCMQSEDCECRGLYRKINERINEVLDDYTLADLSGHDELKILDSPPA